MNIQCSKLSNDEMRAQIDDEYEAGDENDTLDKEDGEINEVAGDEGINEAVVVKIEEAKCSLL